MFDFIKRIVSLEEDVKAIKEVVFKAKPKGVHKVRTHLVDSLDAVEYVEKRLQLSLTRVDYVAKDITKDNVHKLPVGTRYSSASIIKAMNRLEFPGVILNGDNHIWVYDSYYESLKNEIENNTNRYVCQC